jgi:hypothetical protein
MLATPIRKKMNTMTAREVEKFLCPKRNHKFFGWTRMNFPKKIFIADSYILMQLI